MYWLKSGLWRKEEAWGGKIVQIGVGASRVQASLSLLPICGLRGPRMNVTNDRGCYFLFGEARRTREELRGCERKK